MNQYSTVKPLYPGAFPPPAPEEDDAPYPLAPLNLTLDEARELITRFEAACEAAREKWAA